jgi:hypothetical protein
MSKPVIQITADDIARLRTGGLADIYYSPRTDVVYVAGTSHDDDDKQLTEGDWDSAWGDLDLSMTDEDLAVDLADVIAATWSEW